MSHFTVMVFGPENDAELEEALAPFNDSAEVAPRLRPVSDFFLEHGLALARRAGQGARNISPERIGALLKEDDCLEEYCVKDGVLMETTTTNPDGQWDWWVLGGRWRGFFNLLDDVEFDAQFHLGEPGTFEKLAQGRGEKGLCYETLHRADRVRVGDIDFQCHRDDAKRLARKSFARWRDAHSKQPRAVGWSTMRDQSDDGHQRSRERYNAQPAIVKYKEFCLTNDIHHWGCPVDSLGYDEQALVEYAASAALTPFAAIIDGEWLTSGAGTFGDLISEPLTLAWNKRVNDMLVDTDPETIVSLVDCHC